MRILCACEESQAVTIEGRRLGHEIYSCDLLECSGGHPEWHIQGDVLPLLNGNCTFKTMDGKEHRIDGKWDMIIAFPPCTDLAVSGAAWFERKREDGRQRQSVEFFCQFVMADCERVAIENPVGIMSGDYVKNWFPYLAEQYELPRKPSQIIQPYMFGDPFEKKTCLWMKGLPILQSVNAAEPPERIVFASGKTMPKWYADAWHLPPAERAKVRSKTFPGVARAMMEQWAGDITKSTEARNERT